MIGHKALANSRPFITLPDFVFPRFSQPISNFFGLQLNIRVGLRSNGDHLLSEE